VTPGPNRPVRLSRLERTERFTAGLDAYTRRLTDRTGICAPNACLYHSAACAAPRTTMCGVMVCSPSGIDFTLDLVTVILPVERRQLPARRIQRGWFPSSRCAHVALPGGLGQDAADHERCQHAQLCFGGDRQADGRGGQHGAGDRQARADGADAEQLPEQGQPDE
jgi:hypothetical protein